MESESTESKKNAKDTESEVIKAISEFYSAQCLQEEIIRVTPIEQQVLKPLKNPMKKQKVKKNKESTSMNDEIIQVTAIEEQVPKPLKIATKKQKVERKKASSSMIDANEETPSKKQTEHKEEVIVKKGSKNKQKVMEEDKKRKPIKEGGEEISQKRKRLKNVEFMGREQPYYPYTGDKIQLRCSPSNLLSFLQNLTENQKKEIEVIGFGKTLHIKLESIPTAFGYWLLKNYNPDTDIVNDGTDKILISEALINEVFGIPIGGQKIVEKIKPNANDPVVKEWRSQFGEKIPTKIHMREYLIHLSKREDFGRIFKLNFLVTFFTVIAEIMKSNTVNQRFLNSLTTKTDIKELNWCEYIMRCLRSTRKGWFGTEVELYNGPLLILSVLYIYEKEKGKAKFDKKKNLLENFDFKKMLEYENKLELILEKEEAAKRASKKAKSKEVKKEEKRKKDAKKDEKKKKLIVKDGKLKKLNVKSTEGKLKMKVEKQKEQEKIRTPGTV